MPEPDALYWYTYDVLPLVGFVRAESAEHAREVALDDACSRLRHFLSESPLRLDPIDLSTEVTRDDTREVRS